MTDEMIRPVAHMLGAAATFLMADLLIALVHYLMDRHGHPTLWNRGWIRRLIATILINNRKHHAWPQLLLRHSALLNAAETLPIGIAVMLVAWAFDVLTWHVVLFAAAIAYSAVYHRLLHLPRDQVCAIVRLLQRINVLQRREQHYAHHVHHNVNYAVLTNVANWLLESTKVLRLVDLVVRLCCGSNPADLARVSKDMRKQGRDD